MKSYNLKKKKSFERQKFDIVQWVQMLNLMEYSNLPIILGEAGLSKPCKPRLGLTLLRGLDMLGRFSTICSKGYTFLPFRVDPFSRREPNHIERVASLNSVSIPFMWKAFVFCP